MSTFILFACASAGLTLIVVRGSIFEPIRNFVLLRAQPVVQDNNIVSESFVLWRWVGKLLTCCQCSGFWCGMLIGVWYTFTINTHPYLFLPTIVVCGFAGSILAMTTDIILELLFHLRRSR